MRHWWRIILVGLHGRIGLPCWRTEEDGLPPSLLFIASPYDTDAHYARKYTTSWVGYKVHLSETCEDDSPHLITHVATTSGPVADGEATPLVHQALQAKGLLPAIHLVDTGYLDAELLATSQQEYGVDLLGPTRRDVKHKAPGFAAQDFPIDWDQQHATCPEGHTSVSWTPAVDNRNTPVIKIKFSMQDCRPCPSRIHCILSRSRYPRRTITVRPKDHYLALQARREREQTAEYAREVVRRAGIEATISQGVRVLRLRRSRYVGLARTHLSHVLTAAGLNFLRVTEWLAGIPRAGTRSSHFTALAQLARGRLREKIPQLEQALAGQFDAHHRFLIGQQLAHIDFLDAALERVSAEIAERVRPFESELKRVQTIPGVGRRIAEVLLAEIGVDLSRFLK